MHASFWQWLTNAIHRGKLTSPFLLSKQLLTEHFTKRLLKVKAIVLLQVNSAFREQVQAIPQEGTCIYSPRIQEGLAQAS